MKEQNVFIGNTSDEGIYYCKFKNGKLIKKYSTNDFERCTYLIDNETHLYSVIEVSDKNNCQNGYILAYEKNNDKLINIDKKSSYGQGPCHVEISNQKKLLFISNYKDGCLVIMKLNEDGSIGKRIYSHIEDNQKSHLHCIKASIYDEYFFAIDLGKDLIIAYSIKDNRISEVSKLELKKGTEPRHLVVSKDRIYVITEKSCELYILEFKDEKLRIIDSVSILPKYVQKKPDYTGCAIKISKDFKTIYTTVRGHNSISIFKINKKSVKMIQNISCRGNLPRDLSLDKHERYILIANQDSNEISIFRKKLTGKLSYKCKTTVKSPTCILIE